MPICTEHEPNLAEVLPGRFVKCWLYIDHPEKESETIEVEA